MVSPQTQVAGFCPRAPFDPHRTARGRTPGRFHLRSAALGLVLAALCLTSPVRAAFEFKDASWEGSSELLQLARERLGSQRVKVVAKLDFASLTPGDGVLVLHPEVELKYDEVSGFLAAGGRIDGDRARGVPARSLSGTNGERRAGKSSVRPARFSILRRRPLGL